jgi:hypothetical protein
MVALGLKEDTKLSTEEDVVTLGTLSELTGFPVDYIKRELLLSDENELSMVELRAKVMQYLDSSF